jgi:hypothetical protein
MGFSPLQREKNRQRKPHPSPSPQILDARQPERFELGPPLPHPPAPVSRPEDGGAKNSKTRDFGRKEPNTHAFSMDPRASEGKSKAKTKQNKKEREDRVQNPKYNRERGQSQMKRAHRRLLMRTQDYPYPEAGNEHSGFLLMHDL